jgi:hypothetical protein
MDRAGRARYVWFMPVNLIKTAAGLQEIDQLIARQLPHKFKYNGTHATWAYTRYAPKRADEILQSGGSIYWIFKNRIQVRQKILGFEMVEEDNDTWCKIVVEPRLYKTISAPKKAIQGWRYLEGTAVPADRGVYASGAEEGEPPAEMAEELRKLGLL